MPKIDPSSEAIGELRAGMKDVQKQLASIDGKLDMVVEKVGKNSAEIQVMKAKSTLLGGIAAAAVSIVMWVISFFISTGGK